MTGEGITPHDANPGGTLLSLSLLSGVCVAFFAPTLYGADDARVAQAAMTEFFKKAEWNSPEWSKGDLVVVRPSWRSKERPVFEKEIAQVIAEYKKEPRAKAYLSELNAIGSDWASNVVGFDPGTLPPVKDLFLPGPVVVGELDYGKDRYFAWRPGRYTVKGLRAPSGTARVVVSLSAPGFSRNGRYALIVASAPWSIHSADIRFFLKRAGSGWKVAHVSPIFYA